MYHHLDQGVVGGILTMPNFLSSFPLINPHERGISAAEQSSRSTNQGKFPNSYSPPWLTYKYLVQVSPWRLTILDAFSVLLSLSGLETLSVASR
jgi:hypothetical protein